MPFSISDSFSAAASLSNFSPAAFSLSIVSRFASSAKYSIMLSAMTSPMSSACKSSSLEAFMIASSVLK